MVLFSRRKAPDWSAGRDPEREAKCRKHPVPRKGADPWFDDEAQAMAVCNGTFDGAVCPLRAACLAYAIVNREQHGVWGGMRTDDRRALWTKNPTDKGTWQWHPAEDRAVEPPGRLAA
jgi:hypothetical protein